MCLGFYAGWNSIEVNSSHHQGVNPDDVGKGLRPVASDEWGVVESIECCDADRFVLGVQWHPERIKDQNHRRNIFSAFIKICGGTNFGQ